MTSTGPDPIHRLITALRQSGIAADWRDVADIVWLASAARGSMPQQEVPPPPERHPTLNWPPRDLSVASPPVTPSVEPRAKSASAEADRSETSPETSYMVTAGAVNDDAATSVAAVAPRRFALPHRREIERSLRPLKRRYRTGRRPELDIATTIHRFCESGVLAPTLQHAKEPWLDLSLVVDGGPTMLIWRETIEVFGDLLERSGAFRNVKRWSLAIDGPTLHLSSGAALHRPEELVNPSGRQLILVLTDGMNAVWSHESVWRALTSWGRASPTAILQLLRRGPAARTTLGDPGVTARATAPGTPSSRLLFDQPWWVFEDLTDVVPVVTLAANDLQRWAHFVAGASGVTLDAIPAIPSETATTAHTPPSQRLAELSEGRLRDVINTGLSPRAHRLAVLLSAISPSLDLARIVMEKLVPDAELSDLAELLVLGVLQSDGHDLGYLPAAQDVLNNSLTATDAMSVWIATTPHLTATGKPSPLSLVRGDHMNAAKAGSLRVPAEIVARLGIGRRKSTPTQAPPQPIHQLLDGESSPASRVMRQDAPEQVVLDGGFDLKNSHDDLMDGAEPPESQITPDATAQSIASRQLGETTAEFDPGMSIDSDEQESIDLTVFVSGGETSGTLLWTFATPHAVTLPDEAVITRIEHEATETFALRKIREMGRLDGSPAAELQVAGVADEVARTMPWWFWSLLVQVWRLAKEDDRFPTLLLVSRESRVPWELAATTEEFVADRTLVDPDAPQILGAQVSMGRWRPPEPTAPFGERRPQTGPVEAMAIGKLAIMFGKFGLSTGMKTLREGLVECQELASRYPSAWLEATEADATALLSDKLGINAQVLHVVSHSEVDPHSPWNSGVILSDTRQRLNESMVVRSEFVKNCAPLVFLNCPQLATPTGGSLVEGGGLPAAFLQAGARAFIAPLWNISDTIAMETALTFYAETIDKGRPVGDVMRQLRAQFTTSSPTRDQITPLAYVYYGHPGMVLRQAFPEPRLAEPSTAETAIDFHSPVTELGPIGDLDPEMSPDMSTDIAKGPPSLDVEASSNPDSRAGVDPMAPMNAGAPIRDLAAISINDIPHIVSVTTDGAIALWNLALGRRTRVIQRYGSAPTTIECIDMDGVPLAVAPGDRLLGATLLAWDLTTGVPALNATVPEHFITMVCRTLGGRGILATGDAEGTVRVYELGRRLTLRAQIDFEEVRAGVTCIQIGPYRNGLLVVSGHNDGTLHASTIEYSHKNGDQRAGLWGRSNNTVASAGHPSAVACLAIGLLHGSPVLVTTAADGVVRVWSVEEQRSITSWHAGRSAVCSLACTSHTGIPLVIGGLQDGTLRAWELSTGVEQIVALASHSESVTAVLCREENGHVVVVSASMDGTIRQQILYLNDTTFSGGYSPTQTKQVESSSAAHTPDQIAGDLVARGDYDQAVQIFTEQLLAHERLGDVREQAVTWGKIADIYYQRGNYDEALRINTEQLPVYEQLGDVREQALTWGKIADIYLARGEYRAAEENYTRGLEIMERLGDLWGMAFGHYKLGLVAYYRTDYTVAQFHYESALDSFLRTGDEYAVAKCRGRLGQVAHYRGDHDSAMKHLERALELYEQIRDDSGLATDHHRMGIILEDAGDYGAAKLHYEKSLSIDQQLGQRAGIATNRYRLGGLAQLSGDNDTAITQYQKALEIREELGDRQGMAASYQQLAALARARGDYETTRSYEQQAMTLVGRTRHDGPMPQVDSPRGGSE